MNQSHDPEVQQIIELQQRIDQRLGELNYSDPESAGTIVHHLAEVSFLGKKLAKISIPAFLSMNPQQKDQLADLIVDMQTDLDEMKEAILEMESALVKLVNFLNP